MRKISSVHFLCLFLYICHHSYQPKSTEFATVEVFNNCQYTVFTDGRSPPISLLTRRMLLPVTAHTTTFYLSTATQVSASLSRLPQPATTAAPPYTLSKLFHESTWLLTFRNQELLTATFAVNDNICHFVINYGAAICPVKELRLPVNERKYSRTSTS